MKQISAASYGLNVLNKSSDKIKLVSVNKNFVDKLLGEKHLIILKTRKLRVTVRHKYCN